MGVEVDESKIRPQQCSVYKLATILPLWLDYNLIELGQARGCFFFGFSIKNVIQAFRLSDPE
jgi:hypothetical protein